MSDKGQGRLFPDEEADLEARLLKQRIADRQMPERFGFTGAEFQKLNEEDLRYLALGLHRAERLLGEGTWKLFTTFNPDELAAFAYAVGSRALKATARPLAGLGPEGLRLKAQRVVGETRLYEDVLAPVNRTVYQGGVKLDGIDPPHDAFALELAAKARKAPEAYLPNGNGRLRLRVGIVEAEEPELAAALKRLYLFANEPAEYLQSRHVEEKSARIGHGYAPPELRKEIAGVIDRAWQQYRMRLN